MSSSTDPESIDRMLATLSNPLRRRVLLAVSDYGPQEGDGLPMTAVASAGMGDDEPDVLRIKLVHAHLPKLDRGGYVEWDPDAETIRRGPNFDEIAPLVRAVVDHGEALPDDAP